MFPTKCDDCGEWFDADDFLPACPPCAEVRAEMASEIVRVTGLSAGWAKWTVGAVLHRYHGVRA